MFSFFDFRSSFSRFSDFIEASREKTILRELTNVEHHYIQNEKTAEEINDQKLAVSGAVVRQNGCISAFNKSIGFIALYYYAFRAFQARWPKRATIACGS